jgi:hypothetical protein
MSGLSSSPTATEAPGSHGTELDRLVLDLLRLGLVQLECALLYFDDARPQLGPGRLGEPEVGVPLGGGAPLTLFQKRLLTRSVTSSGRRAASSRRTRPPNEAPASATCLPARASSRRRRGTTPRFGATGCRRTPASHGASRRAGGSRPTCGRRRSPSGRARSRRPYFLPSPSPESSSTARKASWGTSIRPTCFMRFLPSFCFSSSLRLRVTSPP